MKALFSIFGLSIAAFSTVAFACECVGFSSIEEHVEAADAIFLANAVETYSIEIPPNKIIEDHVTQFEVIEVLKGDVGDEVSIFHYVYPGACEVIFEPGKIYEVFALTRNDGEMKTSNCILAPYEREHFNWGWKDYRKVANNH
ncbi:hypothetical protein [Hyphococcus sp.]|uniref:hypothetical protein n=1 Tax=Hyphococcus sp. TaxID=2038636 RepID=UPI003CCB85B8